MSLSKESVLNATNNGLNVFKHFLGSKFSKVGKSFKSPFYQDSQASCYVYFDKKSGIYKFKDFGDAEYSGDCFFFVSKIFALSCDDRYDFIRILQIVDGELGLCLEDKDQKVDRLIHENKGEVKRATQLPSIHDGFETAKSKLPIQTREFTPKELGFWNQYGITNEILHQFNVIAIERFIGIGKDGNEYALGSTDEQPMFGYQGRRHTKLYRPFSKLRFLYTGEMTESYVFGFDQLPIRGDVLFITGGEKDVLSLVSHGFHSICFNSETAHIPKNLIRGLGYRFKHITLLYDVDETGIASMEKHTTSLKEYQLKSLRLPLSGDKSQKDISDFFKLGHSAEDLMMLFREMLDQIYEDTIAVMKSCEIDFENPPKAPEPLLTINDVTIGTPGNLVCVAGSEGSGKTNYLGGILSGAIKPYGIDIDTLGTTIKENIDQRAVLLYDTEQSEFQLYKNLTYILRRSSLERPPSWFKAFCLVGISRSERMNLILESMDRFFYEYGGIHMVVIDGIADLLGAVNDEESSVKLVEELFRMAAIYNTVIVCVLHLAPSGMKLRGHLGSEVQRKAAGILLIEKDDNNNCSVVKALKVRDGSPLDVPMVQFGWSKTEGRHVYLGEKSKEDSDLRKTNELKDAASAIFRDKVIIPNQQLVQSIMEQMDVKERTARAYIKFMRENGIIERTPENPQEYRQITLPF
jgi:hypothetical protein